MDRDKEIDAISKIIEALKGLSREEALRAIKYAHTWARDEIKA